VSQENVEVVSRWARQVVQNVSVHQNDRRSYAAKLQRGEFDQGAGAALDLLHPDVTCTSPLGEVYEGKLNYAHYAGELLETLGDYALSLREVTDLGGDQVLADYGVEMRGAASGIGGRFRIFVVCTLRDGLISRLVECRTKREALKAVGLEE
jgi:SnoaL-like protein